MSDLQLGLIVVGILVVAGVYAFNRYQELQLRRRVESRFAQRPDDVLMQDASAPAPAAVVHGEDERLEPRFGTLVDEPEPAPAVQAAEPRESASAGARVEPASAPAVAEAAPSPIDYVCSIEAPEPIAAAALEAFVKAVNAIGKPAAVMGWDSHAAHWLEMPSSRAAAITRVQAAVQLADRGGALNRVQLSSLRDLALQLAERSGGACRCGDIDQAAKAAAEIDRFCSQVDVSVGCNVVPRGGGALAGTKVRGLLESAGFVLEPSGRFVQRAEDGSVLLCIDDIEGGALSVERLRTGPITGLMLTLDVPRVSGGARAFERMLELARHLAHALDAVVVDDNQQELADAGLKVIRQQLKSVHAAMEAQGIPAGGALAARLFS
jgi:FtsZ-interacting cell division protein ZipA